MIKMSNMILIGSTGRNSGKTTLAKELISALNQSHTVIAIKVTTIHEQGICHRGGKGCGVCTAIKENFCITTETDTKTSKDTSLLLQAGAKKVFWLRVFIDNIEEGFATLQKELPEDSIIICESNSLRSIVQPKLFVMIQNTEEENAKPSAKAVFDKADIIIENNLNNANFSEWKDKILCRI